jgi:hypothetical protein
MKRKFGWVVREAVDTTICAAIATVDVDIA